MAATSAATQAEGELWRAAGGSRGRAMARWVAGYTAGGLLMMDIRLSLAGGDDELGVIAVG